MFGLEQQVRWTSGLKILNFARVVGSVRGQQDLSPFSRSTDPDHEQRELALQSGEGLRSMTLSGPI